MTVLDKILDAFQTKRDILELDGENLTELPPEIGMLTELQVLSLSNNQLTCLPAEIGNLSKLVELAVDENCLTELPTEIGRLSSLEILLLSHNKLRALPASLGGLASLRTLNVDHNELRLLPAEIGKLGKLRRLNIQHNRLTELPAKFAQLDSLQDFDWEKWKAGPRKGLPPRNVRNFMANGNPWIYPPAEIMKQQVKVIREYLKSNARPESARLDNPLLTGDGMNLERWASPPSDEGRSNDAESGTISRWRPPACPLPPPLPRIISCRRLPATSTGDFKFELMVDVPAGMEPVMETQLGKEFPELKWQPALENRDEVRIEGISRNSPRDILMSIARKESAGPYRLGIAVGAHDLAEAEKVFHEVIRRLSWALIGWSQSALPLFKSRAANDFGIDKEVIVELQSPLESPHIKIFQTKADILISRTLVEALALHGEVLDRWTQILLTEGFNGDDAEHRAALRRGAAAQKILRQSVSTDESNDLQAPLLLVRPAHFLVGELLELGLAQIVFYGPGRDPGSAQTLSRIKVRRLASYVSCSALDGGAGEFLQLHC